MAHKPKAIAFDVNGTMLDTAALAPVLKRIFGSTYTVDEYYGQTIEHAMATTLAGDYRDLGEIALAVLRMAAAAKGVSLSTRQQEKVRQAWRELPPWRDVSPALKRLREKGFILIALSNSGTASLQKQLKNAQVTRFFDHIISVEAVRRFKPAPEPYQLAARTAGVDPAELLMVAAHPWDLLGAARAGCQTAFIKRPGKAAFRGAPAHDYSVRDFEALADALRGKESSLLMIAAGAAVGLVMAAVAAKRRIQR